MKGSDVLNAILAEMGQRREHLTEPDGVPGTADREARQRRLMQHTARIRSVAGWDRPDPDEEGTCWLQG